MHYSLDDVGFISLPIDSAVNGDLTVIEGLIQIPFSIARVFVVRGVSGSVRGNHAHKRCSQFLTCPNGVVEVECEDSHQSKKFILNRPDVGLLIPPGIWAKQKYVMDNSVLTVLCDMPYEESDYIRDHNAYRKYRNLK